MLQVVTLDLLSIKLVSAYGESLDVEIVHAGELHVVAGLVLPSPEKTRAGVSIAGNRGGAVERMGMRARSAHTKYILPGVLMFFKCGRARGLKVNELEVDMNN